MSETPIASPLEARQGPEIPPGSFIIVTSMEWSDSADRTQRDKFNEHMLQVRGQLKSLKENGQVIAWRTNFEGPTFYTVSVWPDEDTMRRFSDTNRHAEAVAESPSMVQNFSSTSWVGDSIPSRAEIKERLEVAAAEQPGET